MPLTYESIGMPERGNNISNPAGHKNSANKFRNITGSEELPSITGSEITKNKRSDKKRKRETNYDDVGEKNRKKLVVTRPDGKTKTVDASTFHKQHEVAKSKRKKEKAKLYKKRSKQKKKNKQQIPVVDDEKILKECTEYLNKWKNDKQNWKFEKLKQIKLVNNMFHSKRVSRNIYLSSVNSLSYALMRGHSSSD